MSIPGSHPFVLRNVVGLSKGKTPTAQAIVEHENGSLRTSFDAGFTRAADGFWTGNEKDGFESHEADFLLVSDDAGFIQNIARKKT
jgi:hypothetical protein